MDELSKQIQSITEEVESGKSANVNREYEFKRLDQTLTSSKEAQLRRRKQRELLEETYDQLLIGAYKSPN